LNEPRHVFLGVTGSIAAYKAVEICSRLRSQGYEVSVALTDNAQRFVGPATFQTLSGRRVITGLFVESERYDPLHISLAEWADLILIAPATAAAIGRLAAGIPDDVITCVAFASRAPVLIAPAMNDLMYAHPVVAENVEKLRALGYQFVGPEEGRLASGKTGKGRLAAVDQIMARVEALLDAERSA